MCGEVYTFRIIRMTKCTLSIDGMMNIWPGESASIFLPRLLQLLAGVPVPFWLPKGTHRLGLFDPFLATRHGT